MSDRAQMLSTNFQNFLQKVRLLDLEPIAYQLVLADSGPHWTKEKATQAIAHYFAFLYLASLYPNLQLAPTQAIHQVWHQHILDTHKYAEDCHFLFGQFIHHISDWNQEAIDRPHWQRAFSLTQVLFRKHFDIELQEESAFSTGCASSLQRPSVDIDVVDILIIFPAIR